MTTVTVNHQYRGRFAPSPTGPLHFGSLVAAVGSYLRAKSVGGQWLLRIEDIDPPREVAGASEQQLRCLDALGFEWDGPVLYQSKSLPRFEQVLANVTRAGHSYQCGCPRKMLKRLQAKSGSPVYPRTCRDLDLPDTDTTATRLRVEPGVLSFVDGLQGSISQDVETEVGDFVIRRRDGLFAYQLAVVVDDADQGITEIVRGHDLLDNTPRQIYLQRLLGYPTPNYIHLPMVQSEDGQKLSKQTGAMAIDTRRPAQILAQALAFLRQDPPADLAETDAETVWSWAVANWNMSTLTGIKSAPAVSK